MAVVDVEAVTAMLAGTTVGSPQSDSDSVRVRIGEGTCVDVNRNSLIKKCEYFRALFSFRSDDQRDDVADIAGPVASAALEVALAIVQEHFDEFTDDQQALAALSAAAFLGSPEVEARVKAYFGQEGTLGLHNVFIVARAARDEGCGSVAEQADQVIAAELSTFNRRLVLIVLALERFFLNLVHSFQHSFLAGNRSLAKG